MFFRRCIFLLYVCVFLCGAAPPPLPVDDTSSGYYSSADEGRGGIPFDEGARVPPGLIRAEASALKAGDLEDIGEPPGPALPQFEAPIWEYNLHQWKKVRIPEDKDRRVREILVANAQDPEKEILMSTKLEASGRLLLSYRSFLSKVSPELHGPELKLYIVHDGNKILLKKEEIRAQWSSSSVEIPRGDQRELQFVALLGEVENEVALDSITVELLEDELPNDDPIENQTTMPDSAIEDDGIDAGDSYSSFHNSTYVSYLSNKSKLNLTKSTQNINPQSEVNFPIDEAEENQGDDSTVISKKPSTKDQSTVSNAVLTSKPEGNAHVINTFVVLVVVAVLILGMIAFVWSRRRKRKDDEIPVLGRSASEHNNPSYNDETTQEENISIEGQASYNSFR